MGVLFRCLHIQKYHLKSDVSSICGPVCNDPCLNDTVVLKHYLKAFVSNLQDKKKGGDLEIPMGKDNVRIFLSFHLRIESGPSETPYVYYQCRHTQTK